MSANSIPTIFPAWLGQTHVLENATCRVVIAPKIGRIIDFHTHNTPNWFAPILDKPLADGQAWPSYNGDKLWPTAQFLWPQIYGDMIPDPVMDKAAWSVISEDKTSITLQSGISVPLGIQAVRQITLHEDQAELSQRYTLERIQPSSYPVCVWTISSCTMGDYALLDCQSSPSHAGNRRYHTFGQAQYPLLNAEILETGNTAKFTWPTSGSSKIGTYGKHVALIRANEAFIQTVNWDKSACYLEESSLQAWVGIENGFCEIETSSPYWHLRVGESADWEIKWKLVSNFSPESFIA